MLINVHAATRKIKFAVTLTNIPIQEQKANYKLPNEKNVFNVHVGRLQR